MKLVCVGIVVGVLAVVAAGHPLDKRAITTEVVYVTETIADAIVYVDQDGAPYRTSTVERMTSIPTTQAEATVVSSSVFASTLTTVSYPTISSGSPAVSVMPSSQPAVTQPVAESSVTVTEPTTTLPPSQTPEPAIEATPTRSSTVSQEPEATTNSDQFPLGITYDTFKGTAENVQCKTVDEMTAEFEQIKSYGIVRIYGNDCGVIPVAIQEAKKNNQKIMAGIYAPNQAVSDVVYALSSAIKSYNGGDWSIISVVSVENERVNAHVMTASAAVDTINQARSALNAVGYYGPVGAVETVPAIVGNPFLCTNSDLALVNVHAFFDPNTKAENAGTFVQGQIEQVKKACPNKRVVVTESGWPHQGDSHNQAVVSKEAQQAAMNSIKAAFSHDLFLFNAFDSPWKSDDSSTFNSEKFWGIM